MSWSKLGCIAYIAQDGQDVHIRNLMCSAEDGKWSLGEDYALSQVFTSLGQQSIVHLSWNQPGSELAVVDVFGRISIFSILIAMNRFAISRSWVVDQEDDMGAVVGLFWLNIDRPVLSRAIQLGSDTDGCSIESLVSACGKV